MPESSIPEALAAYVAHGMKFGKASNGEACADCPFCGKEGKFGVNLKTGLAHCWSCTVNKKSKKGGCNPASFVRLLWEASHNSTELLSGIANRKGILDWKTVRRFGVRGSAITGKPVLPGYSTTGEVVQLYRFTKVKNKKGDYVERLLPTPSLFPGEDVKVSGLFLPRDLNQQAKRVFVCEGPFDGMALYEALGNNPCVICVPGAGVWKESWSILCGGKSVHIMFDKDAAGLMGAERLTRMLANSEVPPEQVMYLNWSSFAGSAKLAQGYDVRDYLTPHPTTDKRKVAASRLVSHCELVPDEWKEIEKLRPVQAPPLRCESWGDLSATWDKAMSMRQDLTDALAVMLAVTISTSKRGDQLFLQTVAAAGAAKTRLADALLTNRDYCYPIESVTGFVSGLRSSDGDDFSLISRINGKTLITSEGDTIFSMPPAQFAQCMSQMRRIFDGSFTASYRNRTEDLEYAGLRCPWIIVGTHAMLDRDMSKLGDRFLKLFIDDPNHKELSTILDHVIAASLADIKSKDETTNVISPQLMEAYRRTGGYVGYLRSNCTKLLDRVIVDDRINDCAKLGTFAASVRIQPSSDHKKETSATKELPTRLTSQFVRLAVCVAAVLGKEELDEEVMRLVSKVAYDTARGTTLELVDFISLTGDKGTSVSAVESRMGWGNDKAKSVLRFLEKNGILEQTATKSQYNRRWRLPLYLSKLHKRMRKVP